VTARDNPYFARAGANRVWGHFFGLGIVDPVDDFNDQNKPSNPELLDTLSDSFKNYGYDQKELIRWICNSNAYNLSCVANSTNDAPDKEVLFSRMLLKSMSPEQLFESLVLATKSEAGESTKPSKAEMRGARPSRRRWVIALPALAVTAVLATGCTADSWPQLGSSSPTPTPTPTVIAPDNQKPPAVTESQAKRIIEQISSTLEKADGAMDIELAKTRLDGAALAARTTDYALRTAIPESPVPAAIPTDDVEVVLPEATDRWPRTVLLLTKSTGDETAPPVILTMTQQDPWSNYKITDIAEMLADTKVPEVVAPWLGTSLVPADSAFLSIAPGKLAETFADVVDANEQSPSYGSYDDVALAYAKSIRDSRQAIVDNLAANNAATTSQTSFDIVPSDSAPVSMTTLDSGAIVAVTLIEAETVTPTSSEAVIRFENNPEAKALTGVTESAKGITTKYEFQLFFAVPAQGSTEQIHLLAARQNLLSVEVIK